MYKALIDGAAVSSDKEITDAVEELAKRKGCSMAQIAMAWSRTKVTSPIIGISSEKRLQEAIDSLAITLTPDEIETLEKHYLPRKVLGHF